MLIYVLEPVWRLNECPNPSFETDDNTWAGGAGNAKVRTTDYSYRGVYSLAVTHNGANDAARLGPLNLDTSSIYMVHSWIRVPAGWDGGNFYWDPAVDLAGSTGQANVQWVAGSDPTARWFYVESQVTIASDGNGTLVLRTSSAPTAGTVFHIDAVVVEKAADGLASSTFDGDTPDCWWRGDRHASPSVRPKWSRAGGIPRLLSDYNFKVQQLAGLGFPEMHIRTQEYTFLPGTSYEGVKINGRSWQLAGTVWGKTEAELFTNRKALFDLVKKDLVRDEQQATFWFKLDEDSIPIELDGAMEGPGMTGDLLSARKFSQAVGMRMFSPDPYFRSERQGGAVLDGLSSLTGVNNALLRDPDGNWTNAGGGVTGGSARINAIQVLPDGRFIVGGSFTSAFGTAADNIAIYDPVTGTASEFAGGTNGEVFGVFVAPNSDVYFTGAFTSVGGTGRTRIAWYDWSASALGSAFGTGLSATGYVVMLDRFGNLYVGGFFGNANGVAVNGFTRWDPLASTFVNLQLGDIGVYDMALDWRDNIYLVGTFNPSSGPADGANGVAHYNPRTGAYDIMEGGLLPSVGGPDIRAVTLNARGYPIVVGDFQQKAFYPHIDYAAEWTGSSWVQLGPGLGPVPYAVEYLSDGLLWFLGSFKRFGPFPHVALPDGLVVWNGTKYDRLTIDMPGSAIGNAVAENDEGYVLTGWDDASGTAQVPGVEVINNPGTAEAFPVITIQGVDAGYKEIYHIINHTAGRRLFFDELTIAPRETLVIDLRPFRRAVYSLYPGSHGRPSRVNRMPWVSRTSDLTSFSLLPGDNHVDFNCEDTALEAHLIFNIPYWTIDGMV